VPQPSTLPHEFHCYVINLLHARSLCKKDSRLYKFCTKHLLSIGFVSLSVFTAPNRQYIYFDVIRGRAIDEAVSRWLSTAAALVKWDLWWTKWRRGRFSPSTSVSPAIHSTKFSILTITEAGTIGQWVADVPSGTSLDSTPHYANWCDSLNFDVKNIAIFYIYELFVVASLKTDIYHAAGEVLLTLPWKPVSWSTEQSFPRWRCSICFQRSSCIWQVTSVWEQQRSNCYCKRYWLLWKHFRRHYSCPCVHGICSRYSD
jgi:hypothetical protein